MPEKEKTPMREHGGSPPMDSDSLYHQEQPAKKQLAFSARSARDNFALIANNALRDPRISYRAKGILAACLSHSAGYTFNKDWILQHGTEGRDAIVTALKELRKFGYLINVKIRNDDGRICGERYEFCDEPARDEVGTGDRDSSAPVDRETENQRPEKPDAGKPGRKRIPIRRRPIEENPPLSPRAGAGRRSAPGGELPDWLEGCREELAMWQRNRAKAHPKLPSGITKISMRGLLYAKERGVLQEFCEYAAESNWQSLGFAGYRDYIDKLVKDKNGNNHKANQTIAPINYTLG